MVTCLELMKDIPDGSIDAIICDLPYGVLNKGNKNSKWDSVIPFIPLWKQYERIIKDNGAIMKKQTNKNKPKLPELGFEKY